METRGRGKSVSCFNVNGDLALFSHFAVTSVSTYRYSYISRAATGGERRTYVASQQCLINITGDHGK